MAMLIINSFSFPGLIWGLWSYFGHKEKQILDSAANLSSLLLIICENIWCKVQSFHIVPFAR